ncbi:ABC transporter permease [Lachnoclostridium phytofermentans]|uniref:Uncharacterized protein n=1 Tax=Lachnoclostridium phytofermentans (strain ATCC 700394 / DSM 18823 / ISDg) TaxID=357809 RepID=A9KNQ8_LACP7|nr:ABC transporter permease [Lachnoclostridium phytofermentans]ABX41659.1 hypothetical protein Cphy_1281 [Lachnoclostridium phytofermentans ISDg]
MFKLIKYELRKQWFSKLFILIVMGILELSFLFNLIRDNKNSLGITIGIMTFVAFTAIMFVSFECIMTYSKDLKTKQSYMLFLTPNSTYKIVGAKVITSVAQIGITAAFMIGVVILNMSVVMIRYKEIGNTIELIQRLMREVMGLDVDYGLILIAIFAFLLEWIEKVIMGMLAITLSTTFLSNTKGKGIVSLIIFFVLNYIVGRIGKLFMPKSMPMFDTFMIDAIFMAFVIAAFYLATAWMLDKKVSV